MSLLGGKKGLVVGIANEHSIAWGCAKAFHVAGAEVAITFLNQKAESYVRPLAEIKRADLHEAGCNAVCRAGSIIRCYC